MKTGKKENSRIIDQRPHHIRGRVPNHHHSQFCKQEQNCLGAIAEKKTYLGRAAVQYWKIQKNIFLVWVWSTHDQ